MLKSTKKILTHDLHLLHPAGNEKESRIPNNSICINIRLEMSGISKQQREKQPLPFTETSRGNPVVFEQL